MSNVAIELAEKIMVVIADSDLNTAGVALRIAELLLTHRSAADIDCRLEMLNDDLID